MSKNTDGWQPIETAPKDGTLIIVYTPATEEQMFVEMVEGVDNDWYWNIPECFEISMGYVASLTNNFKPSHWRLPEPNPTLT